MHLSSITLFNYKNHAEFKSALKPGMNGIVGPNGVGKTNLLESIYYALTGTAYFHRSDKYNIRQSEEMGMIKGKIISDEGKEVEINIGLFSGKKKTIQVDGVPYEKVMDYIGTYPTVMIAPGDISLINGHSEDRRRFFDRTIAQGDKQYLQNLSKYTRLIDQRNKQLKLFYEQRYWDSDLIHVMDAQIAPLADKIADRRSKFIIRFIRSFEKYYKLIEGGKEKVNIAYESVLLKSNMADVLKENRDADKFTQRTTHGPHKDDFVFTLNELPIKKFGSQGQIKTFLISLNLAAYDYLRQESGKTPFLLLDDIFEKIDHNRAKRLMDTIEDEKFGQVFVTDTDRSRLESSTENFEDQRTFITIGDADQNGEVVNNLNVAQ